MHFQRNPTELVASRVPNQTWTTRGVSSVGSDKLPKAALRFFRSSSLFVSSPLLFFFFFSPSSSSFSLPSFPPRPLPLLVAYLVTPPPPGPRLRPSRCQRITSVPEPKI
ncbi:unnamed protein product [Cutaneotrichosporon oleaginosum]